MKPKYILIQAYQEWHKSHTLKDSKIWLRVFLSGKHLNAKNMSNFVLIEATCPKDATDDDYISFEEDGRYTLHGRAEAVHYTGEALLALMKGIK